MKKIALSYLALMFAVPLGALADDTRDMNSQDGQTVATTVNPDAVNLQETAQHQAVIQAAQSGQSIAPTAPDPNQKDYWKMHDNYSQAPGASTDLATNAPSPEAMTAMQMMISSWNKPALISTQNTGAGISGVSNASLTQGNNSGAGSAQAQTVNASALSGDVYFATLTIGADSYVSAPVTANIDSGIYKGSKVLGKFQVAEDGTHMILIFNQLSTQTETIAINAMAIPQDAQLAALTGNIDHHFFERYLLPLGIDFLSAAPSMLTDTGQEVTMNENTTVVTSPELSSAQKTLYMAGYAANEFSSQLEPSGVHLLPEVKIPPGTGFGLLLLSPIVAE